MPDSCAASIKGISRDARPRSAPVHVKRGYRGFRRGHGHGSIDGTRRESKQPTHPRRSCAAIPAHVQQVNLRRYTLERGGPFRRRHTTRRSTARHGTSRKPRPSQRACSRRDHRPNISQPSCPFSLCASVNRAYRTGCSMKRYPAFLRASSTTFFTAFC